MMRTKGPFGMFGEECFYSVNGTVGARFSPSFLSSFFSFIFPWKKIKIKIHSSKLN
jgi:hypothetical protein